MKMRHDPNLFIARVSLVVALSWLWTGWARGNDDVTQLARLVEADGEEYVRLRDGLLKEGTEPWEVRAGASHSWKCGLTAFILNERMHQKDAFGNWDTEVPVIAFRKRNASIMPIYDG